MKNGLMVLHADPRTLVGSHTAVTWKHDIIRSNDHMAYAMLWTCQPTTFDYTYKVDEHLYIIEGEAFVTNHTDPNNKIRIGAGDYVFFPSGSTFTWEVVRTIRKVAVMHEQVPVVFGCAMKLFNRVFRRNR